MPTYVYKCRECGVELQIQQKMTDPPATDCSFCGEKECIRRVPQVPGIAFKGPGFYKTDYSGNRTFAQEKAAVKAGGEAHMKFED